jgi:uncharacterized membrane protein YwaF
MLLIKQTPSIENYLFYTILFTTLLVSVVIAMYYIPYNKTEVAVAVAVLSVLSIGSNIKLISLLSADRN